MPLHPDVQARLDRLTPDQRAAATAEHGPVLCLAPAGSGKTTTLVARIAWLVATGTPAERIAAIAFNKRAADELEERVTAALGPLEVAPGTVRVRTFHAFGREILRAAGRSVEPLVDRDEVLRRVVPEADAAERRRLDTTFSALKLEHRVDVEAIAADPEAGPRARAFVAYERAIAAAGGLDFDDLVARPLALLEAEPELLAGWRSACAELLVDEVQDVDRSQLELGPADRRPGEPDLPGRRRRPVDLRLAARRRPAGAGPGRATARPAPPRPGDELPLSGPGRGAGGPARRGQRRAVRQADRGAARAPSDGSSLRRMPPTTTSGHGTSWPPGRP